MTDPLSELVDYLRTDGKPPLAWIVEHAPDGSLQRAWRECRDPLALIDAHGLTIDRRCSYGPVRRGSTDYVVKLDPWRGWYPGWFLFLEGGYNPREFDRYRLMSTCKLYRESVEYAPVVRSLLPMPPTLAELIERARGSVAP